ncbi:TIM-barrel domain-containing protein, partial [Lactobacillus acidophilus]
GLLKKIHDKGIKVCVWINPYIAQKSRLFEEGMKNGYFIKKSNGDVWQWDKWQAGMAIVDFTNPDAVKWYQGYLKELLHQGVDVFKTDFGERIPSEGVKFFDGSDPKKMHNYYTLLYNKIVTDAISEVKGKKEALVFARSATVGSQCYPVHWGGDSSSNYSSMAETLRSGLSFSMSGFGYWSHDISGFEASATP